MGNVNNLITLILVNSKPIKTKTGELVLPCYTSRAKTYFEKQNLEGVRVIEHNPDVSTSEARLKALSELNPEIGRLMEVLGCESTNT